MLSEVTKDPKARPKIKKNPARPDFNQIIHYLSDKLLSSGRMGNELAHQNIRTFDKATDMST